MNKELFFDTLSFAENLHAAGIENASAHAHSLAEVLQQNLYIKAEVDKMIDDSLKEFRKSMAELGEKHDKAMAELSEKNSKSMAELSEKNNKAMAELSERARILDKELHEITAKDRAKFNEINAKDRAEFNVRINEITNNVISRLTINLGIVISIFSLVSMALHYIH